MKKTVFLIVISMILLAGCNIKGLDGKISSLPADNGAKEITIEVVDYGNFYNDAAKKFESKKGVKVNVINYYNAETGMVEDVVTKANAEMMAGKGADLYAYDYFDFKKLGSKGLICDLKDWVSQDAFFSNDKLFMNVLNAAQSNNNYAIPLSFTEKKLDSTISVPGMEKLEDVTWEQFFNKEKDFNRSGRLINIYDTDIFELRFTAKADNFIDQNNKGQHLDSKEMVELLQQCKSWADQNLCIPSTNKDGYNEYSLFEVNDILFGNIYELNNVSDGVYYPYNMPSDTDKNHIDCNATAKDYVVINSASKSKKTSWDFLKFLLDFQMQASQELIHMPINRAAFTSKTNNVLSIMKREGFIDNASIQEKAILDNVESIKNVKAQDQCTGIVRKEAYRYFIGETSAEQAAKEMASKVKLYLMEQ